MRKIYSLLLGLLCMSTASAQSWTEPTVPTEGSDPVSGHIYRVKNTEEGLYLAYGTVWFGWNTTAMMVDPEAQDPLSFTLTEEFDEENNSLGWTFKNYDGPWPNQYVFVSGNDIAGFAMHVDNPTDPSAWLPRWTPTDRVPWKTGPTDAGAGVDMRMPPGRTSPSTHQ